MAAEINSLIVSVRSDGIENTTKALNSLADASDKAEGSTSKLTETSKKSTSAYAEGVSATTPLLAAYQKQVDLLGANVSQTNAYNVAMKGGSAVQQQLAMSLGAQVDAYKRLAQDQAEALRMNKQMDQAQADLARSGQKFLDNLKTQTDTIGMSAKALRDYQVAAMQAKAAQLGVSDSAAPMIQAFKDSAVSAGHASSGAAGIGRELLVLGHELSQGQFNRFGGSMIVLAERINFIPALLEKVKGIAESLNLTMGQLGLGIAGVVLALGAAVVGIMTSIHTFNSLNNALILSGNYAGITVDGLNEVAIAAAKTGGSLSSAREIVAEFAATGKFTADQIRTITPALVDLEHATGDAQDGVKKSFISIAEAAENTTARSSDAVYRSVLKMNSQYHLLSTEQVDQVRQLESQGKALDAASFAYEHMADVIKNRSHEAIENFTPFGNAINDAKKSAEGLLETLQRVFATRMPDYATQVKELANQISIIQVNSDPFGQLPKKYEEMRTLLAKMGSENAAAEAKGAAEKLATQEQFAARSVDVAIKSANKLYAAQSALDDFALSVSRMKDEEKIARAKEIAETWVKLEEATHEKVKKARAMGTSEIDAQIKAIEALKQTQLDADKEQIASINEMYKLKKMSAFDTQYAIEAALRSEIKAQDDAYAKEQAALKDSMSLRGRSDSERNILQGKLSESTKLHEKAVSSLNVELIKNSTLVETSVKKAYDDESAAIQKSIDSTEAKTKAVQTQVDAYNRLPASAKAAGVTDKQMADQITQSEINNIQKKLDAELTLVEVGKEVNLTAKNHVEELTRERDAAIALRDVQVTREAQQATNKAAQEYTTAWKQSNKQIGDDLASAIIDGGGKGWKKLLKDMEMGFAKAVLQPLLSPISGALASAFTPAAGSNGTASTVGSISSGYNLLTSNMTAGIGKGIGSIGSALGSSTIAEFGSGFSGSATAAAEAMGAEMTAAASAGASLASAFSAAVPWVAAAAIAFKAWNTFFEDGPEKFTRLTFASNNTAGNISINERGNEGKSDSYIAGSAKSAFGTFGVSSTFWAPAESEVIQSFIKTVAQTDDALSMFLSTTEKANVTASLTGKTSVAQTGAEGNIAGATEALSKVFAERINNILEGVQPGLSSLVEGFTGTSQALATETASLLQYRQALVDSGEAVFGVKVTLQEVAAFKLPTEAASVALTRVTTAFTSTNQVLNALGKTSEEVFGQVGLASYDLRQSLVVAAGGASNLTTAVNSFTDNFLSSSDKIAPVQKQLGSALESLGYSANTTKDQYKDLVLSQNLSTEAGQKMFVSLLALGPAFTQVAEAMDAITSKQKELDMSLLSAKASGETDTSGPAHQALLIAQRKEELDALAKLSPALVATQQAIYDVTDANELYNKAVEAAKSATNYRIQILTLEGDKLGALSLTREQEMKGLSEADKISQTRVYQLQDEASALEDATKAQEAATKARADALALQKSSLSMQLQIQQAEGNNLEVSKIVSAQRQIEIDALDNSLKPLQVRINQLQDEDKATKALAETKAKSDALFKSSLDLQIQIQKAEGNTARVIELTAVKRQLEIESLDKSLQPLQERLNQLEDESAATKVLNDTKAKSDELAKTNLSMQLQIQQAEGDTAQGRVLLNATRQAEIDLLDESLKPLKIRLNQLADEATAQAKANTTASLNASLLSAQGNASAALAITRSLELQKMTASDAEIQKRIYALTDEAEATKLAKDAQNTTASLSASLLQAQGNASAALDITRGLELQKMTASDAEIQKRIYALQDETTAAQEAKTAADALQAAQNTTAQLNANLLQLQGDAAGALAISRSIELQKMTASDAEIQKRIYALTDEAAAQVKLTEFSNKARSLQIELATALGQTERATAMSREDELAALAKISPALATMKQAIYDASDAATIAAKALDIAKQQRTLDITLMTEQGDTVGALAAKRMDELAAMDSSLRATQQLIYAAQDLKASQESAAKALESAKKVSDDALTSLNKALQDQQKSQQDTVDSIKTVFDMLATEVDKLYGSVSSTAGMLASDGAKFISDALAAAKTSGALPDSNALSKAIAAVQQPAGSYASQFEEDKSKLLLAGQLSQMKDIFGPQLTDAQKQLEATDALLKSSQDQLNTLRGINTATLSVAEAVEAFQVALTGEQTAKQAQAAASATVTQSPVKDVGQGQYNPNYISGLVEWNASRVDMLQNMVSSFDANTYKAQVAPYLAEISSLKSFDAVGAQGNYDASYHLPSFDVGTDFVPHDMIAQIHKGEQIVPAKFNPAKYGSQSGNEALVAEVKALRAELAGFRADNKAGTESIAGSTGALIKLHKRWDGDGIPATRTTT